MTISDGEKGSDDVTPLSMSRPNEKYGATAAAESELSTAEERPFRRMVAFAIVYLSVLIADMTRGVLFPTVITCCRFRNISELQLGIYSFSELHVAVAS